MKLQFEFPNEKIVFETYLQNGLHVVEGSQEYRYNAIEHAQKIKKVFTGILRKNMSELVATSDYDSIEGDLRQMLVKLDEVADEVGKGIRLCEELKNEKEKSLLTIETIENER